MCHGHARRCTSAGNSFKDEGAKALADALMANRGIKTLGLISMRLPSPLPCSPYTRTRALGGGPLRRAHLRLWDSCPQCTHALVRPNCGRQPGLDPRPKIPHALRWHGGATTHASRHNSDEGVKLMSNGVGVRSIVSLFFLLEVSSLPNVCPCGGSNGTPGASSSCQMPLGPRGASTRTSTASGLWALRSRSCR